jgi:hypothetical protein
MASEREDGLPSRARLFIPACGDRLKLTAPWKFSLYLESRNMKLAKELKLSEEPGRGRWAPGPLPKRPVELPAGTILECDRVYIRQYNKGRVQLENDYDSITWKILREKGKAGRGKISGRFWVKLPDCYSIEYELEWDSLYRDRVTLVDQVHDL